jgi:hypothetical protein
MIASYPPCRGIFMAPARQDSHSRSEPSDDGLLRAVVRYQPLWLATSMSQLLCSAILR